MDDKHSGSDLLLPDLVIENFRGIKKMSIPNLGRVTLLAGRNGVGKTTVLEAIQVYAAKARYSVFADLLDNREEISNVTKEESRKYSEPDWSSLIYGRDTSQNLRVVMGPRQSQNQLGLETVDLAQLSDEDIAKLLRLFPESLSTSATHILRATYQEENWTVSAFVSGNRKESHGSYPREGTFRGDPSTRIFTGASRVPREESSRTHVLTCEKIGPGLMENFELSRSWDSVALTDDEGRATHALSLIYGDDVSRVAVVGDERSASRTRGRRAIVRLKSNAHPVPLKSLGDGAVRLFGVALLLANSRDGFLLIDEAENGIHHTIQGDYWRMVLQTAHENNVQVFATTHSWDCVRGFALAATENENVEGVLVRLEKEEKGLRAVRYSGQRLKTAAEQRIEVR